MVQKLQPYKHSEMVFFFENDLPLKEIKTGLILALIALSCP